MPKSLIDTPRKFPAKRLLTPVYDTAVGRARDKLYGFHKAKNDRCLTTVAVVVPLEEYVAPDFVPVQVRTGTLKQHLPLKRDKTRYIIK